MSENGLPWRIPEHPEQDLTGKELACVLREHQARGVLSTTFESDTGLILQVVTNRRRAMVMLLAGQDEPRGHAIDAAATGSSDGYLLDNGQEDEYSDRDTVPLERALMLITEIAKSGAPPADGWQHDG